MQSLLAQSASYSRARRGGLWTFNLVIAGILVLAGPATPAEAQGLFDLLFGGSKPAPITSQMPRATRDISGSNPFGVFRAEPKHGNSDGTGEHASGGTYRTVCVRMCDGFFVPMSYATTRSNFQQDQNKCRATCGDDARLFFYRNPGSAMEEAVDLSGRAYGRMPNAFRFRKTLVEGCNCRPQPWSEAELARHRAYAAAPQSPVPGQPLPVAIKVAQADKTPAAKETVAETAPTGHAQTAAATIDDDETPAAVPAAKQAKTGRAYKTREAAALTPRVIRAAAQSPSVSKPPAAQPGLFGYNGSSSMGLTGKAKLIWPGD